MDTLSYTNFCELKNEELQTVDGGSITLGAAVVVVLKCCGVIAGVSFVGGCIYECIFG